MPEATLTTVTPEAPTGLAQPTPVRRRRRVPRPLPEQGLRFEALTAGRRSYLLAISRTGRRCFTVRSASGASVYRLGRRTLEEFTTLKRAQTRFERLLRTQLARGYRQCEPNLTMRAMLADYGFAPTQIDPDFAPVAARFGVTKRFKPRSARTLVDQGWRASGAQADLVSEGRPLFLAVNPAGRVRLYGDYGQPTNNMLFDGNFGEKIATAGYTPLLAEITMVRPVSDYAWRPMFADLMVLRGQALADLDEETKSMLIDELVLTLNTSASDSDSPSVYRTLPISRPTPKRLVAARLVSPTGRVVWVDRPRGR